MGLNGIEWDNFWVDFDVFFWVRSLQQYDGWVWQWGIPYFQTNP